MSWYEEGRFSDEQIVPLSRTPFCFTCARQPLEVFVTDAKTGSWCEEGDSNPYTLAGVRT